MNRILSTLFFSVLLLETVICSVQKVHYPIIEKTDEIFIEKWNVFETSMKEMLDNLMKQALPILTRASSEVDLSPDCLTAFLKMLIAFRQYKTWAFAMLDATGKPLSGNIDGTVVTFGSYEQCMNIIAPSSRPEEVFRGQYCTLELRPPLPPKPRFYRMDRRIKPFNNMTVDDTIFSSLRDYAQIFYTLAIRYGLCVPSTCSKEDIQSIADQLVGNTGIHPNVTRCEIRGDNPGFDPDNLQIGIISLLGVFAVLVALGTLGHALFDFYSPSKDDSEEKPNSLLRSLCLALSALENTKKLLRTDALPESPLDAMHGIRVLTMFWIILGHTYLYVDWQLLKHFRQAERAVQGSIVFQTITNGSESVDVFFYLGGVLLSYGVITIVDKKGLAIFNIPIIFVRRIWRLLPITMIVVGLAIVMPLIGSAPMWHEYVEIPAENCRRNWWPILIFGNNYIKAAESCLIQSWYISADMQIFILGIIILYIFFKNETLAKMLNFALVFGSILANAVITYINDYPPVNISSNPDQNQRLEYSSATYFQMYPHLGPYGIGLAAGFMIARRRDINITRKGSIFCWILSTTTCLAVLYGPFSWTKVPPTLVEAVFHASLYRIGWCLGLAWVTFACATGRAGYVSTFLSWKAFVPFSRLTFMMYLMQVLIMQGFYGYERIGFDCNHVIIVWFFFGNFCVTILVSFLCRLLFEAPLIETERLLFKYVTRNNKLYSFEKGAAQTVTNNIESSKL